MVREHIDQMIRTRVFKARNERIGTGVLVKSRKGRNVRVERKLGECFQWRANGQCSKGVLWFLTTVPILVKKHNHPLLLRERRPRRTEESIIEMAVQEGVLQD